MTLAQAQGTALTIATLRDQNGNADAVSGVRVDCHVNRTLNYANVFGAGSSARFSITLSIMPKSRAMSAVRNLSRSNASSIA